VYSFDVYHRCYANSSVINSNVEQMPVAYANCEGTDVVSMRGYDEPKCCLMPMAVNVGGTGAIKTIDACCTDCR
jgi:hypothetical protein